MELEEESLTFLTKLASCGKVESTKDIDDEDCKRFWRSESVVKWFEEKGYTTYKKSTRGSWYDEPRLPFDEYGERNHPYAYHQAVGGLAAVDYTGKIVYAQDSERRHVAIKLTRIGTDEYRILKFIHEQGLDILHRHCILPILELLHCHDVCFAVMPRWGSCIYIPKSNTLGGFLLIMQSMLKALMFLHSNNIVHRDMNLNNMVVDFFGNALTEEGGYYSLRRDQLQEGRLSYALIDFDLSLMLPPDIRRESCRLHRWESSAGSYWHSDVLQGEFDYNPFAFDVGTLGVVFCESYQKYTTQIPMLAPFLDRMVTRDAKKRFTAAEALEFLDNVIQNATEAQLSIVQDAESYVGDFEEYDRWKGLPDDFQAKWAEYREPVGIPFSWKLIRAVRGCHWLPESLIPNFRRFILKSKNHSKRIFIS